MISVEIRKTFHCYIFSQQKLEIVSWKFAGVAELVLGQGQTRLSQETGKKTLIEAAKVPSFGHLKGKSQEILSLVQVFHHLSSGLIWPVLAAHFQLLPFLRPSDLQSCGHRHESLLLWSPVRLLIWYSVLWPKPDGMDTYPAVQGRTQQSLVIDKQLFSEGHLMRYFRRDHGMCPNICSDSVAHCICVFWMPHLGFLQRENILGATSTVKLMFSPLSLKKEMDTSLA